MDSKPHLWRHLNAPVRIDIAGVVEERAVCVIGYGATQQLFGKPYHLFPGLPVFCLVAVPITEPAELTLVAALSALLNNLADCVGETLALDAVEHHVTYGNDAR